MLIFLFSGEYWIPEDGDDFDKDLVAAWVSRESGSNEYFIAEDEEDQKQFKFWWQGKYHEKPTCDGFDGDINSYDDVIKNLDYNYANCSGIMRSGREYHYEGVPAEYEYVYEKFENPSRHFTIMFNLFVSL